MTDSLIDKVMPEIIKARHHLHSIPELLYEEKHTSQFLQHFLKSNGYDIQTNIAKTGIAAVIDSGKPGKTVALRADMDGLPVMEETELQYASKNIGAMHACGHDGHMATLLAIAKVLPQCKDQFKGKIKLIFQPAEEGGAGAREMINEGVLENPQVDAIFGYHNMPLPLGKIGVKSDCIFAAADFFKIKIYGKSAHAAFPERSIDPIWIGANIIQALQSVVSRSVAAVHPIILSITEFHAGNTINVIPGEASLTVSLRTASLDIRSDALHQCRKISSSVAESLGGKAEIIPIMECPPTMNTKAESDLVLETAKALYGEKNVIELSYPTMATEDFSFYLERVPGCFFLVGNGDQNATLHTSTYQFQDSIIPIAANVLLQSAFRFLNN